MIRVVAQLNARWKYVYRSYHSGWISKFEVLTLPGQWGCYLLVVWTLSFKWNLRGLNCTKKWKKRVIVITRNNLVSLDLGSCRRKQISTGFRKGSLVSLHLWRKMWEYTYHLIIESHLAASKIKITNTFIFLWFVHPGPLSRMSDSRTKSLALFTLYEFKY
jgi:hypothetical protein